MFNHIEATIVYTVPCHWVYLSAIGKDRYPHSIQTSYLVVFFHHKLPELFWHPVFEFREGLRRCVGMFEKTNLSVWGVGMLSVCLVSTASLQRY